MQRSAKIPTMGCTLVYCSLSGLFLLAAADAPLSRERISCQKGLGLVYRKRRTPRDSTLKYSPRGLTFSDGPRMTPYHKKLLGWAHNNLRKVTISKHLLSHSLHVVVGYALNQLEVILLVVVALLIPTCDSRHPT